MGSSRIRRARRARSTRAEVEDRRTALLAIVDGGKPMTVRQVFYLVAKSELGYGRVQTDLTILRRRGTMRPEVNNLSLSSLKTMLLIN